jgi:polygalacturonase
MAFGPRILTCFAAALALLLPGAAQAQSNTKFPDRVCNVRDYGARAKRVFPDTAAFQRAIDACAAQGGGTVEVPRGEYLIGPIFLKSNIRLNLSPYSELVASTDEAEFKVTDATRAWLANDDFIALINIADASNVAITGKGRIDGQGAVWWEKWRARARVAMRGGGTLRPRLIKTMRSSNLLFEDFTVMNSPSFHLVVEQSEGVTVRGMSFIALSHSPNTDAIDPTDTRNMLIENNYFDVGDDIVAIKSQRVDPAHPDASVENIVIRGNRGRAGRGICIGSGTIGGVRNVLIENNHITGAMYGLRIKTMREKGGLVQDIVFRDNVLIDVLTPFVFSSYYLNSGFDDDGIARRLAADGGFRLNDQIYPPDSEPAQPYKPNLTPWMRNITVDGLIATGADRVGLIIGLPERPIEGLVFRNVDIQARTGLRIRHAAVDMRGLTIRGVTGTPVTEEAGAKLQR